MGKKRKKKLNKYDKEFLCIQWDQAKEECNNIYASLKQFNASLYIRFMNKIYDSLNTYWISLTNNDYDKAIFCCIEYLEYYQPITSLMSQIDPIVNKQISRLNVIMNRLLHLVKLAKKYGIRDDGIDYRVNK